MKPIFALAIALVLTTSPARAAPCHWEAGDGAELFEVDPTTISISEGGNTRYCQLRGAGTGVSVRIGSCGDLEWAYFSVPSVPDGPHDILIFQNTAWYRVCPE